MFTTRRIIISLALGLFFVGAGIIVYKGRPVEQLRDQTEEVTVTESEDAGLVVEENNLDTNDTKQAEGLYKLAEVESHSSTESCWAAVNDGVYDLTSWISRHPGGPDRITALCGTDATAAFTRMHGKSSVAQAALVLLKIGSLN